MDIVIMEFDWKTLGGAMDAMMGSKLGAIQYMKAFRKLVRPVGRDDSMAKNSCQITFFLFFLRVSKKGQMPADALTTF